MADIQHKNITGADAAHPPFFPSESDPGTSLGPHSGWRKPSTGVAKIRNAANTAWEDISIEGTSAGSAPSLADLSDVDVITTPPGDGEALVWDDTAGEWVPGSVAAGSVDAADVAYAGGAGMSATNVESAIDELATEKANDSALTAHIDDTADAHDATAISYAGGTGMSATQVEAAIDELATEKANDSALTAHISDTSDAHDASAISVLDAATQYTATDVEGALAEVLDGLQAHEADATDAHDASAISVLDTANQYTATNVEAALAEVLDSQQAHEADTTGAHDASAISFNPAGSIAATNVQSALEEVASEAGGGGSAHTIKDEGSAMTQRANLNFIGAGVTVTDDAGNSETEVTIPGGGGGTLTKVYAQQDSTTSLSTSVYTKVLFATTGEIDALSEWDAATGTFTAASTKRVHFDAIVSFNSNTGGYRVIRFYLNGAQTRFAVVVPPVNGDTTTAVLSAYLDLTSGDTVDVRAITPGHTGTPTTSAALTSLTAHGVG